MDAQRLPPPETPRRQLLKRIHRRSSILPSTDPSAHLAPSASASTSTSRSNSRRASLNTAGTSPLLNSAALERHDEADEDHDQADDGHDASPATNVPDQDHGNDVDASHYGVHTDMQDHDDADENGEEAAWAQVDELMDTVQLKNQRILQLEKDLAQCQRDLQAEKGRIKPSSKAGNANAAQEKGLTRAAAVKLEREFLSQEMILKGLQRDNEDKTLEVEALRRKLKLMSDFLARQYGPDDWEAVVQASSGLVAGASSGAKESAVAASPDKESLSAVARLLGAANAASPRAANRAIFTPLLGNDAMANLFSPMAASPTKTGAAINNDDELIPTIARLHTPASSPSKMFVSSFARPRTSLDNANDELASVATEEVQQEETPSPHPNLEATDSANLGLKNTAGPSGLPAGIDRNVLLASIESVRLLIQGFERKNAMRRAELEATIDNAVQAERRAERLQAEAAALTTPTPAVI
ncbi:hypothetical protein L1887_47070 [Cichorium endivia]|nr:hypothetical protein L1887_47070 [Cichorium endivia]